MSMRSTRKLAIAAALAVLLAALLLAVFNLDYSRYRHRVEDYVTAATGRTFVIDGQFQASLGRSIFVRAEDIRLANADWGSSPEMLQIGVLELQINLWSLISGPTWVQNLMLADTNILVEANADGVSNWEFDRTMAAPDSEALGLIGIVLQQVEIQKLHVEYGKGRLDGSRTLSARHCTTKEDSEGMLRLNCDASMDDRPIEVSAQFGPFENLRQGKSAQIDISAIIPGPDGADTENEFDFQVHGMVWDAGQKLGYALGFNVSGDELDEIARLLGIAFLPSGTFQISGQLANDEHSLDLHDIAVRVGDVTATLAGTITGRAIELKGTVSGPSADAFVDTWQEIKLPDVPFDIDGGLRYEFDSGALSFLNAGAMLDNGIRVRFDGLVGNLEWVPYDFSTLDLDMDLSGPILGDLLPLGDLLENELAYTARGRVRRDGDGVVLEVESATVGDVDVSGTINYLRGEIPVIDAELHSDLIDLTSVVDDDSVDAELGALPNGPAPARWLPDLPIATRYLNLGEVDLDFTADTLRFGELDVTDIELRLDLRDGNLRLGPFTGVFRNGSLAGSLTLDSSQDTSTVTIELTASDVVMDSPNDEDGNPVARPHIDAALDLSASGNSLYEMLASANGSARMEEGTGFIEFAPLKRLLGAINPPSAEELRTALECAIILFDIEDGVATSNALAIQTDKLKIAANGRVNLATEEIHFRFKITERQGIRVSVPSVFSPLVEITGMTFAPKINLSPGPTAAALITGGWTLVLETFASLAASDKNVCEESLERTGRRAR